MTQGELLIGKTKEGPMELPVSVLKRHVTVLGASGSGKTVMGKCLVEEATLAGIPSILIDPQGDLASLALGGIMKDIEEHDGDPARLIEMTRKAEVRIFTPASSKGLALSIDPLRLPRADKLSTDERIRAVDMVAKGLTQLLGYDVQAEDGKSCTAFLYQLIEQLWERDVQIRDFVTFADIVADPEAEGLEGSDDFIIPRVRLSISKKLRQFSVGIKKLMFNFGIPLDMEVFLTPANETRVPINIIYLNTLTLESDKQFFVSMVAKEIYQWMLQNPTQEVQLVFYIDEVSTYLPPHPRNPPAKEMLTLLFKQGRKYGVSCLMCTQNPADIDYKAMAQANTWALGRMMTKQDLSKVSHMLKSMAPEEVESIMNSIPHLSAGHFILICPDIFQKAKRMQVRWLLTQHSTLDEDALDELMPSSVRDHFNQYRIPVRQRIQTPEPVAESKAKPEAEPDMPGPSMAKQVMEEEAKPVRPDVTVEPTPEPPEPDEFVSVGVESSTPESMPEPAPGTTTPGTSHFDGLKGVVSHLPGLRRKDEGSGEPVKPDGNLRDYALVPRLNVSQSEVTHIAQKERESTYLLFKGEDVGEIRLFYLPIYHVEYDIEKKRLGLVKVEHKGTLVFHGESGQMLVIETDVIPPFKAKEMAFTTQIDQQPWEYKELSGFRDYALEYIRKNELSPRTRKGNQHTFSKVRVRTKFKRLFGEVPTRITPSYLPVWELNLHDRKIKGAIRKVYIDGVLGKELELE